MVVGWLLLKPSPPASDQRQAIDRPDDRRKFNAKATQLPVVCVDPYLPRLRVVATRPEDRNCQQQLAANRHNIISNSRLHIRIVFLSSHTRSACSQYPSRLSELSMGQMRLYFVDAVSGWTGYSVLVARRAVRMDKSCRSKTIGRRDESSQTARLLSAWTVKTICVR